MKMHDQIQKKLLSSKSSDHFFLIRTKMHPILHINGLPCYIISYSPCMCNVHCKRYNVYWECKSMYIHNIYIYTYMYIPHFGLTLILLQTSYIYCIALKCFQECVCLCACMCMQFVCLFVFVVSFDGLFCF